MSYKLIMALAGVFAISEYFHLEDSFAKKIILIFLFSIGVYFLPITYAIIFSIVAFLIASCLFIYYLIIYRKNFIPIFGSLFYIPLISLYENIVYVSPNSKFNIFSVLVFIFININYFIIYKNQEKFKSVFAIYTILATDIYIKVFMEFEQWLFSF
ncbi:MAG: hypothetical protein KA275_00285 [Chitinophagaceae bacterium]|nr:hypothetical protein [Chitinophagaceae bacterium]